MERYRTFRPTGFDAAGIAGARHGISEWFVAPVTRNRDSGTLEQSNWDVFLREMGGESDTVQVHRFGHWACGWFEVIVIDPADTAAVLSALQMQTALEDYPILDDDHFSEAELNAAIEYWQRMSVSERVSYLQRADQCIFAARRAELPDDDNGRLLELLTRD